MFIFHFLKIKKFPNQSTIYLSIHFFWYVQVQNIERFCKMSLTFLSNDFRYGGYCPQFKYQIGQTFGKTTSRLLEDPNVPSSGRLVLTEIYPGVTESDRLQEQRKHLLMTRTQSWGDQKLVNGMVPGYTGN